METKRQINMCQNGRDVQRAAESQNILSWEGPTSSPAPGTAQVYQDASPWMLWNVVRQVRQCPFRRSVHVG